MAILKIKALHGNVQTTIDYIMNKNKVADNCSFSSSCFDPSVTGLYWTTRNQNRRRNAINGFHLIMSFPPNTVSTQDCFMAAQEFVKQAFGDEFDFCMSVHKDQQHIHSHIVLNPRSKIDQKSLTIKFKRDLPILKSISDQVCQDLGLPILENEVLGNAQHYLSWLKKNPTDHELVKNTIDALIPKVKSVDDLFTYMKAIGFEFKGIENEKGRLDFSIHEKLIQEVTDDKFVFRLPYTQRIVEIDREYVKLSKTKKDETIAYISFPNMEVSGKECLNSKDKVVISAETIRDAIEDKTKKSISVKLPNRKKYVRLNRLDNGEYTLEKLESKITRTENDPSIQKVIDRYKNVEKQVDDSLQKMFFKDNAIPYPESPYAHMTNYQKFIHFKQNEIQKTLDRISTINTLPELINKLAGLDEVNEHLTKQYGEVANELNKIDAILKHMLNDIDSGLLKMTDKQLEDWIDTHRKPIIDQKQMVQQKMIELNHQTKAIQNELDRVYKSKEKKNKMLSK